MPSTPPPAEADTLAFSPDANTLASGGREEAALRLWAVSGNRPRERAMLQWHGGMVLQVAFSPAYMEVDNTYLVPAGSPVQSVDDADRPGVRIGVPARSAPDLFLTRALRAATLLRVPGGAAAALELLSTGGADAYAENAHLLTLYAARLAGSRVLDGRYTVIRHAMATPRARPFAANYVRRFVEDAKQDGTVDAAIRAAGLRRVRVAPPER